MGEGLTGWTLKHLNKAYPLLDARSLVKAKLDEEVDNWEKLSEEYEQLSSQ